MPNQSNRVDHEVIKIQEVDVIVQPPQLPQSTLAMNLRQMFSDSNLIKMLLHAFAGSPTASDLWNQQLPRWLLVQQEFWV
jgi:hypothetical protein